MTDLQKREIMRLKVIDKCQYICNALTKKNKKVGYADVNMQFTITFNTPDKIESIEIYDTFASSGVAIFKICRWSSDNYEFNASKIWAENDYAVDRTVMWLIHSLMMLLEDMREDGKDN